jgi:vacuolar-type H+-ATPase subunit E/Vma4
VGIDALRSAVEKEARAKAVALEADARARAQALRSEAAAAAAARLDGSLRDEEAALRRETATRIADARRAAQSRVLEARETLLERIFALAREQLPAAIDTPSARSWLIGMARDALAHMPDGSVVLECSAEVAVPLREALAAEESVQFETDPELPCGFRARSASGAIVIDVTLARLLDLQRPKLAIEVLQRLAAGAGP